MPDSLADSLQLQATIAAWEAEASAGRWQEPAPVCLQSTLGLVSDEPSLIGSGWDSWSCGDHWLYDQQIDELTAELPLDWSS
ncbi:hypothetical protein [Cyanobium sp. ULC084]|nr:MAG: hypothetical protein DCF24_10605 [Cyanobium sp.]PZU98614.1 MAG: hypothetical protein DCF24_10615 [Cyanobium sp.]